MRIESGDNTPTDDKSIPHANPALIYRSGWNALPPKFTVPLKLPVSKVVYVSTKTKECHTELECEELVGEIQRTNMVIDGYPDIKYNFLIGGDNRVYEGRGWYTQPSKEEKFKDLEGQTLDIAYIGDFDDINPTKPMAIAGYLTIQNGHGGKIISDEVEVIPIRHGQMCRTFKINFVEDKEEPALDS